MAVFDGQALDCLFNENDKKIYKKIHSYDYLQLKEFSDNDYNDFYNTYRLEPIIVDFSFENAQRMNICKAQGEVINQHYLIFQEGPEYINVLGFRIGFKIKINDKTYINFSPNNERFIYMRPLDDDNYEKICYCYEDGVNWLEFYIFIPESSFNNLKTEEANAIVKKEFQQYLSGTKTLIERMNNQINEYNKELLSFVKKTINDKINCDSKLSFISNAIGIDIRSKNDSQNKGEKIEILPKKSDILLPKRKKYEGYYIDKENYNAILSTIRNHLASTEEHPLAIRKLNDEEMIRDTILWALNSNYFIANGESFRQNGKTDILISFNDKSAFVTECKVWRGEKYVSSAIDQLLSYTTWRDSKGCIIVFNLENKDFSLVNKKMIEIAKNHKDFKRINLIKENEFECDFVDQNNSDSTITITFFCANYVTR